MKEAHRDNATDVKRWNERENYVATRAGEDMKKKHQREIPALARNIQFFIETLMYINLFSSLWMHSSHLNNSRVKG